MGKKVPLNFVLMVIVAALPFGGSQQLQTNASVHEILQGSRNLEWESRSSDDIGAGVADYIQHAKKVATTHSKSLLARVPAMAHRLQKPTRCPDWMAEYAAFHKQTRGKASAKYLVHNVDKGASGFGDRIRGMMYVARLAVSLKRVVLFTWGGAPHEPDRYLAPSSDIDWRMDGINGYKQPLDESHSKHMMGTTGIHKPNCSSSNVVQCFRVHGWHKNAQIWEWIARGGLRDLAGARFISLLVNAKADARCDGCPSLNTAPDMDDGTLCLFQYLFKLRAEVWAAVEEHLLQMFGTTANDPAFKYVALHLRLGGMPQEMQLLNKQHGQELEHYIRGIECSEKLGLHAGINTSVTPAVLITDHHKLRRFVQHGHLTRAVTPKITPVHLARMSSEEAADEEQAMSSYIDLGLMAGAECLVASHSGFSKTAWLLGGGKPCKAELTCEANPSV